MEPSNLSKAAWASTQGLVDMSTYTHDNLPNPEDPNFLDSISGSLQAIVLDATDELMEPNVSVEQLEIQLRRESMRLISEVTEDNSESVTKLGTFWSHATLTCWHIIFMAETAPDDTRYEGLAQPQLRKLPIILLEDILECCPLPTAVHFFQTFAPKMFPVIFGPLLWHLTVPNQKESTTSPSNKNATAQAKPSSMPCWLPFLKLSNNLLKRLKMHMPEQLLKQNTKQSVTESVNTSTNYEEAVASIMLILCQVYPLGDKSAYRPMGSQNDQAVTLLEHEDEFDEEQMQLFAVSRDEMKTGRAQKRVNVTFSLYESFWTLQKDFSRPNSIPIEEFSKRLRSLVTTLEHTQAKPDTKDIPSSEARAVESCSHRYLTSSRLLPIQLQDKQFRIQILTQVLIVCHHLSDISALLKKQVSEWQTRALALLKKEEPQHLALLQSVFEKSENSWRKWRKSKPAPDLDKRQSAPLTGRKRKRSLGGALSPSSALGADGDTEGTSPLSQKLDMDAASRNAALKESCKKMRQSSPPLQKHLEEYVDALDPESGIEAEYHPKNNAHFCWRAMRLLSAHHLGNIGDVSKRGDFEGMVRNVYSATYDTKIPGEMPEWMQDNDEDDEKEPFGEGKQKEEEAKDEDIQAEGDQEDAEMEDVSDKKEALSTAKKEEEGERKKPLPVVEKEQDTAGVDSKKEIGPSPNPEKSNQQDEKADMDEEKAPSATVNAPKGVESEKAGNDDDKVKDEGQPESAANNPPENDDVNNEAGPVSNKHSSATENEPAAKGGFAAMDKGTWSTPPSKQQSELDAGGAGSRHQQQQQQQQQYESAGSAGNAAQHPQHQQRKGGGDYSSTGRSSHDNNARGRGGDYRGGGQGGQDRAERFDRTGGGGGGGGRDEPRSRNDRQSGNPDRFSGNRQRNDDRDHRSSDRDRSWQNDDRGRDRGSGGGRRDDRRPMASNRGDDRYDSNKGDESRGRDHHNRNQSGGGGGRYGDNDRRSGGRSGGDYASGGRSSHDNNTSRGRGGDYRGGGGGGGGQDRDRSRGAGPRRGDRRGGRH